MKKSGIKAMVKRLNDVAASVDEYQEKVAALTWNRTTGPLSESEKKNLNSYHEELSNLRGIRAGIWIAAELGEYDGKLAAAMIEDGK